MEKITKRVIPTRAYVASSDLDPIDLPKEGLITEVRLRIDGVQTSGLASATVAIDGFKKIIQNLKIQGDGGRTYLGLSMEQAARLLCFLNEAEFGSTFLSPRLVDGATAFQQSLVFHPGSNPKDPFDLSAVIPARALSTLQALITPAANTVLDSADTTAITTRFEMEINEVLEVPVPAGIMTPLGSSRFLNPGATGYSDFSYETDVPTGAWLRRIILLVQTEGAVRADDILTALKLKLPKAARAQIEADFEDLKVSTAKRYGMGGALSHIDVAAAAAEGHWIPEVRAGFAILDLRDYFHPIWGANLTEYNVGDVKLGMTIAAGGNAGDDVLLYFDQLMPVESQYVGK